MYQDHSCSSSMGAASKNGEVELVSRFLAPLCARDEAARNIALAAARTTVEGWLGGVGSPDVVEADFGTSIFRCDDRTSDGLAATAAAGNRNPSMHQHPPRGVPRSTSLLRDDFRREEFFARSITNNGISMNEVDDDPGDRFHDDPCIALATGATNPGAGTAIGRGDGNCEFVNKFADRRLCFNDAGGMPISKGFLDGQGNDAITAVNFIGESSDKESLGCCNASVEPRTNRSRNYLDSSSSTSPSATVPDREAELLLLASVVWDDETPLKNVKTKGAKQKVEQDDPDCERIEGNKVYGKSPRFDDEPFAVSNDTAMKNFFFTDFDTLDGRNDHFYQNFGGGSGSAGVGGEIGANDASLGRASPASSGVVFNTLDGFEVRDGVGGESMMPDCARKQEDREVTTAGQIKGPLSQDDDASSIENERNHDSEDIEGSEVTPGDVGRMLNLGNALDGPRLAHNQPNKYLSLVTLHLPVILRLSVNCPFQNVRTKCAEILQMVKERGLPVPEPAFDGPSAFVPTSELPDLGSHDERTHMLLMDAFLQNNRLDHVSRVMAGHPTYLEHFLRTQHFILRGDGPLPYDYRHLIAIMAAGRHQCSYLINLQKGEFLLQGGASSWLQGLKSIPSKLQDLYEINKILAHRPWLLNKTHIEKLTKGADNWSLAEVVHAIVLLAHFHSLSSFVFSCGINEELDSSSGHHHKDSVKDNGTKVKPTNDKLPGSSPTKIPGNADKTDNTPSPPSSPSILGEQEVGVETLMERMRRLSEKSESYQITQEELSKRFETVESQSAELTAAPQRSSLLDSDIGLFIEDPTFIYQDFAKRGQLNDIPTFRVQDYSWDDHGYSLVNRLYNDVGNLLDDKFKTAYNLTYYTMGTHSKVDTSRFRRAIWNYIQCMFGIRHDDYDYNEVNQLLERSLKTFIKSAVCYPERVTKRDYDRVMREFKHSEKIHVNLMILEARMQAELLYALRAVMRYMT